MLQPIMLKCMDAGLGQHYPDSRNKINEMGCSPGSCTLLGCEYLKWFHGHKTVFSVETSIKTDVYCNDKVASFNIFYDLVGDSIVPKYDASHCSLPLSLLCGLCVCVGGGVDMLLDVCCSFSLQPNLQKKKKSPD